MQMKTNTLRQLRGRNYSDHQDVYFSRAGGVLEKTHTQTHTNVVNALRVALLLLSHNDLYMFPQKQTFLGEYQNQETVF